MNPQMKAVLFSDFSKDFSNIKIQQIQKPVPAEGQVLVKVNVAAINPIDSMLFQGGLKGVWYLPLPFCPGYDLAGVVETLGAGVNNFAVGERVFCVNWGSGNHGKEGTPIGGAFAEYCLIPAKKLSKTPAGLSDEMAAAVCLAGTTAYQCLFEAAKLASGQRILILGGAGAVGCLAIQLAKAAGAYVITTCSERSRDFVEGLRPDMIIDYEKDKWEMVLSNHPVDCIFDTVGDTKAWERGQSLVKSAGSFLSIVSGDVGYNPSGHPPLRFASYFCFSNSPAVQDDLAGRLVAGTLKLPIQQVFPFTNKGVVGLFEIADSKRNIGKNLLRISGN